MDKAFAIVMVALLAAAPTIEARVAIPFGIAAGLSPAAVFALALTANLAVVPLALLFLNTLHAKLLRAKWYARLFERTLCRVRSSAQPYLKYGWLGLAAFVALPLPGTGAWSGSLLAWVLGIDFGKALLGLGAGIAGLSVVVVLTSTGIATILP